MTWNHVADAEALIDLWPTTDAEVRAQATIVGEVVRQLGLVTSVPGRGPDLTLPGLYQFAPVAKPKVDPEAATLTLRESAHFLGVSPRTVARLVNKGTLQSIVVSGRPRIRRTDLERFVAGTPAVKGPDPREVADRLFERHHRRSR